MSMISYQWSLKDTSVTGLGMDSKLKNVKCKKIYEAIRLTLLFFFCSSAKASLGILRVLNIGTKLLRKMFLTTSEKKKTSEQPNKKLLTLLSICETFPKALKI